MGDVIMIQPALRALKNSIPDGKLTLLTSHIGARITPFIPEIDETIPYNLPWVKNFTLTDENLSELIVKVQKYHFDGAIIFTNFSQSAHPSAVIAMLSTIPKRLAYSKENVYNLLTDWVLDTEPFTPLLHGVERNLKLVEAIGAYTMDKQLFIKVPSENFQNLLAILSQTNLDLTKPWVVVHPGVEDEKRQFPIGRFAETARQIIEKGYQIVLTGTKNDEIKVHQVQQLLQKQAINLCGKLPLGEFLAFLRISPLVIANNTGVVHMAAAVKTPVIVLYARTNPEHTPWHARSYIFYFDPPSQKKSKTPLLEYISPRDSIQLPKATTIATAALEILSSYTQQSKFQFL